MDQIDHITKTKVFYIHLRGSKGAAGYNQKEILCEDLCTASATL